MSELLSFVGAIVGAYDGPIAFSDLDGQPVAAEGADEINARAGSLYIQALQEDGSVPFVWGIMPECEPADWQGCRLAPSAVLHRDGTSLLFWAFEQSMTAAQAQVFADAFESGLDEPVPTAGTNDWVLVHDDVDTFYTHDQFTEAYGEPPADEPAEVEEPSAAVVQDTTAQPAAAEEDEGAPWEEDLGTYADAAILAPYDESDPKLLTDIVVTAGAGKDSRHWKPVTLKLGALIAMLCQHKVGPKDGMAWVLADMVPGQRLATAVKALTCVGLDIDTGMSGAEIDRRLKAMGKLAIRYTTHSHMKCETRIKKDAFAKWIKDNRDGVGELEDADALTAYLLNVKHYEPEIANSARFDRYEHEDRGIDAVILHAPMPKHRIVLPFLKPFAIADQGSTQKAAMEKWKLVPAALARELGDLPLDRTGTDPSRLFYLPRHDKNAPFEISLFGGDLFDWETIQLTDFDTELLAELSKGKGKSTTDEGRELGRWSMKRAHGFQIAEVLRDHASDRIRSDNGTKLEIECPFDDYHSNPGDQDDRACMAVSAGDGVSDLFTVSCRHESCQGRTNLDMVGKMLVDNWFERAVLEDETYNALAAEDAPNPEVALRIEAEDKAEAIAKEEHEKLIDGLSDKSTDEEIEGAVRMLLEANLSTVGFERNKEKIKKSVGVSVAAINKVVDNVKKQIAVKSSKDGKKPPARYDDKGRLIFSFSGDIDHHTATETCIMLLQEENAKQGMPFFAHLEQRPVRLVSLKTGRKRYDEVSTRALWSELNKRLTFVRVVDEGADTARAFVPKEVGDQVYETSNEELPPAPEIVYTPIFNSSGQLICKPGYYESENILIPALDFEVPAVATNPTEEEVKAAVDLLRNDLLIDFPFSDTTLSGEDRRDPSEANAMAMILTPFMRRMINGCTPVFFVSKPVPGTGGTFLGKIPLMLFDGEEGAPMIYTDNPEEMAKSLLAGALQAKSHMFFDDVKSFNNREIMRAVTSTQMGGRVLGASKTAEVANRFNWISTGNNPNISSEMERRICWVRLNAKVPDIQNRKYRHPDLHEWMMKNRSQIIGAILIIIQNWIANHEMAPFTLRKQASFEDWAQKVGGVLQAAGIEGFLDNRRMAEADMEEAATRYLVRTWYTKYSEGEVKPADLFEFADQIGCDLIEGNAEDRRTRNKFYRYLNQIENRTYVLEQTAKEERRVVSVIKTVDAEQSAVYKLKRLKEEELEQG